MTSLHRAIQRGILVLALAPLPAAAQAGNVRARENLRAAPNGDVIGVVEPGLVVAPVGRRDQWLQVDVEGWVWMNSLRTTAAAGHDLVVSAAAGENLRARPSGAILGHFGRGTLLDEQERLPGWIRVRRRGWIWGPSVDSASAPQTPAPAPSRTPAVGWSAAPAEPSAAPARAATAASGVRTAGTAGAVILGGPSGDTLARVRPGAQLQVLAREGNWARVRVEGWTWLPAADSAADMTVVDATPAQLAADPERYRGRVVSWDLQFLSLERAERIRTEFFEGEPVLLTRHAGGGYAYVALPQHLLAKTGNLLPLERITVVGRVRAPASALTGSPILDLIDLVRARDRR